VRLWNRRAPPHFDDIGHAPNELKKRNLVNLGSLLKTEPKISGGPT